MFRMRCLFHHVNRIPDDGLLQKIHKFKAFLQGLLADRKIKREVLVAVFPPESQKRLKNVFEYTTFFSYRCSNFLHFTSVSQDDDAFL